MPAYVRPDQKDALEALSKATGRPMQEFLREGIDLVLRKYQRRMAKEVRK